MQKKQEEVEKREQANAKLEKQINNKEEALNDKDKEIEDMEKMIMEMQQQMQQMTRQNSGVGASTFAETDYVCGSGNSVNDNDDNVNIGSNEDVEDSALMRFREQSQEKNNTLMKSKNS